MTSVSPNTPTHGNYHNYHRFGVLLVSLRADSRFCTRYHHNPLPYDPRLALLPRELLIGARVLDIGCNEGWVSCELGAKTSIIYHFKALTVYSAVMGCTACCGRRHRRDPGPNGLETTSGCLELASTCRFSPLKSRNSLDRASHIE